jgi:NAD(P)-dependent dehydrogenase (short-subunit alcohol dehydrogenase family)
VTGVDIAAPTLDGVAGFTALPLNLRDGDAVRAALAGVGVPDAVVHAAGVLRTAPLGALDEGAGELMWQLHVQAATRLADQLLPAMAAAGRGRLVLVGSRVASGMPGRSQYAATKAALVALAKSWAAEVVAQGVTVNVVSPAATDTGMLADPARASSSPRVPPIGRLIQPHEIAALVRFLLSSDAAAITGQELQICGGASLNR